MCLILLCFNPNTEMPLVVAANRDEFYARPAAAAHFWHDADHVFAGRDLTAGGTWLGISRGGRFAALTNFSAGEAPRDYPASRGALVADFLVGSDSAGRYAKGLTGDDYAGYNLLLYDGVDLVYTTNKGFPDQRLGAGSYGLANAELDASWPKSVDGAAELAAANPVTASQQTLLQILSDTTPPDDHRLPDRPHMRAMPLATRRGMAARFIAGADYGTRAMTLIKLGHRHSDFLEQQVGPHGAPGTAVFARVQRTAHD